MSDAIDDLAAQLEAREPTEPGQQTRLARHLGVTPGLVYQWLNRIRPIAPHHARGIETYTEGRVSRYRIAPEVFGQDPATDGLPIEQRERVS